MSPPVLIVQHDPDIELILRDIVEHEGFRVVVVQSGRDAITKMVSERFSALFLDGEHPGMRSTLKILKHIHSDLQVILVGPPEILEMREFRDVGIWKFLCTPFSPTHIRELLQKVTG